MPLLRLKEIRDMSSDERIKKLGELRTELTRLKTMVGAGGSVENPARIRELHRTIAQMLTINHEQKIGVARAKPKKTEKTKEKKSAKKQAKKKEEKEKNKE
jgi:large subunit ribosomal protein L29